MFPAAILTGGLATRLRPITEKYPKALVEVAGQPFICHQLHYLREQGLRRIVLCTGHLGNQIENLVGNGSQFGLEVCYSKDGPKLRGTGGALRQALALLGKQFFVIYGDSFLPVEFAPIRQAFLTEGRPALMTVLRNSDRWDKSNVLYKDGRLIEYNKQAPRSEMDYIDYGLGILSERVFIGYPEDQPFDLADVYHRLSVEGMLTGYEVFKRFYEIGSHSGLKEAEDYFQKRDLA